jgi:hypothetical protein
MSFLTEVVLPVDSLSYWFAIWRSVETPCDLRNCDLTLLIKYMLHFGIYIYIQVM